MFSKELNEILCKYENTNKTQIDTINSNIKNILSNLSEVRDNLSGQLQELLRENKDADELYCDIKSLNEQIAKIQVIPVSQTEEQEKNRTTCAEIEEFNNMIYVYIVDDDICPVCNIKLNSRIIHYSEKEKGRICNKNIRWHQCSNCHCLYALDYNIVDFKIENTNIVFDTKYYNKVLFHDTIVIFNINRCSAHNHAIEDLVCDLPVILPNGQVEYQSIPIIHCKTCKKYVMLKATYDKLNGIPVCIIVNETYERRTFGEDDFYYGEKGGSKLYKYGYNVNCTDKLTEEQRHTILLMQLLSGNITKGEIYSILDTNISSGIKRKNSKKDWSKAVDKWKADKEFIENVEIDKESQKIGIEKLILMFAEVK